MTSARTARSASVLGSDPRVLEAFRNRPPWLDGLLARRLLAGLLTLLAGALVLRGDPGSARTEVLVASRDLAPGALLTEADLRRAAHEAGMLPAGAVREASALVGATLAGAMRAGEVFTDLRTVSPRLAGVATGAADARIVPLRLADPAVADILRAGDRVDVVSAADTDHGPAPARTLAADAAVVLVAATGAGRDAEPLVLVAMDTRHATAVAAASLGTALTVVFR